MRTIALLDDLYNYKLAHQQFSQTAKLWGKGVVYITGEQVPSDNTIYHLEAVRYFQVNDFDLYPDWYLEEDDRKIVELIKKYDDSTEYVVFVQLQELLFFKTISNEQSLELASFFTELSQIT